MKKVILFISCILYSFLSIYGQDNPTSFSLSGFKVSIVKSDQFSVEYDRSIGVNETLKGGALSLAVNDQSGRVPKGEVVIYTNRVDSLSLHNCSIDGNLSFDELYLEMNSSFGHLTLNVPKTAFVINAGSQLSLSGTSDCATFSVGAAASVDARQLVVQNGSVDVTGHASLSVNIKNEIDKSVGSGHYTNKYKAD